MLNAISIPSLLSVILSASPALPQASLKQPLVHKVYDCSTQAQDEVALLQAFAMTSRTKAPALSNDSNSTSQNGNSTSNLSKTSERNSDIINLDLPATAELPTHSTSGSSSKSTSDHITALRNNGSLNISSGSNMTRTCAALANQSIGHGYLQNARFGRTRIELFRDELRLLKKNLRILLKVEPYPETPADFDSFFCYLRIRDLAEVQLELDRVDSILAEESAASPKLARTFNMFDSKDEALHKLNITGCDVQDWNDEVENTFTKLTQATDALEAASRIYNQSLTNTTVDGETVVSNRGDFETGAQTLQRMKRQIVSGSLGYIRLAFDGSQLLAS